MKTVRFLLPLLLLIPFTAFSQVRVKDSCIRVSMISFSFGVQKPFGEMADRFGPNTQLGVSFLKKSPKNITWGADFNYHFGNDVRDTTILDSLKTIDGYIIDGNGMFTIAHMFQRGFSVFGKAGKIFPFQKPNPNSGIFVNAGLGFFQHKIRIEVADNTVPQLVGDYRKGYDRLTSGIAFTQYFGYFYMGNSRVVNFSAGLEMMEALTRCRRDFNFDTMEKDDHLRLDLLLGLRIQWSIPFYSKNRLGKKTFYY